MPRTTRSGADGPRKRPIKKPAVKSEKPSGTPEYLEYLERYDEFGEGRPRLSAEEFELLDDEYLELFELRAAGTLLSDDQDVRLQELMFLLIDPE